MVAHGHVLGYKQYTHILGTHSYTHPLALAIYVEHVDIDSLYGL